METWIAPVIQEGTLRKDHSSSFWFHSMRFFWGELTRKWKVCLISCRFSKNWRLHSFALSRALILFFPVHQLGMDPLTVPITLALLEESYNRRASNGMWEWFFNCFLFVGTYSHYRSPNEAESGPPKARRCQRESAYWSTWLIWICPSLPGEFSWVEWLPIVLIRVGTITENHIMIF